MAREVPADATAAQDRPVEAGAGPAKDMPAPLAPGLYMVATPIGTATDITLRALDILARADILAAEDTRRTRHLLDIHGIALAGRRILPYHDHNGPRQRPVLLAHLARGASLAYVSDAGTPLIADPGWRLVQEAIAVGHQPVVAPGASALLAALTVAGLPTDRFLFAGFPPVKVAARCAFLEELAAIRATLVFFESPRRVAATLRAMAKVFGASRPAAFCRELTKRFEETRRGSLGSLASELAGEPAPKGECVLLVGPPEPAPAVAGDVDEALRKSLASLSVRDAARAVAEALGLPRQAVYARALEMRKR